MIMTDHQLPPVSKPYWHDTIQKEPFPPLDQSIKTDVAIVGGGITGITTAYLLSQQDLNVTLIDADTLLSGTTGHTTAKITAQHGLIYDELTQHFGQEKAQLNYEDRKSTRLNSSHVAISYAVFCLKKKKK